MTKNMRTAVIDIGTNTILMLIGEYDTLSSEIMTILDIQRIPRLGRGVDSNKNILPESSQKAITILSEYKRICHHHEANKISATATSFIRDANNKNEFIELIRDKTGIEIEILSGESEARWTFWGGVFDEFRIANNELRICTLDIGGGSTEITIGKGVPAKLNRDVLMNHPLQSKSINIGSVRIKERFLTYHPPGTDKIKQAEEFIFAEFARIDFDVKGTTLIGVAGTITTLGAIILKLDSFMPEKVDGLSITLSDVNNVLYQLSSLELDKLYAMGNYMEGRADIILPGILILKCFMEKFGFEIIKVSAKGLRYGIFLREWSV